MTRYSRDWPIWALGAALLMLAAAHAFETFGRMLPCTLCLKQREIYWLAAAIAAAGIVARFTPADRPVVRFVNVALAAVFLFEAAMAGYHAGVEWKWWPGPAACSGGATVSAADLAALLHGGPRAPPACDKPAWVFLGLSMAGWNFLAAAGLAAYSVVAVSAGRSRAAEAEAAADVEARRRRR